VEEALPETRKKAAIKTLQAGILQSKKSLMQYGISEQDIRSIKKNIEEQEAELKKSEEKTPPEVRP
jgi:hypothetical protein